MPRRDHSAPNSEDRVTRANAYPSDGLELRLPIAQIDSSPLNPRKRFAEEQLRELAASLELDGLLQPILVKRTLETGGGVLGGDRYEIVAGERRWRAAKLLGWTEIRAIARRDIDQATHVRLALLENLARTDLDPLEEAAGYQQLQDLGMTQQAIAEAVHRSQPSIANAIRLLKLPDDVRSLISGGELSASHGIGLLRWNGFPAIQSRVATMVLEQHIPSKELDSPVPPDHWTLAREGLVREVSEWRATFNTKICEKCPFGAYRKGQHSGGICLKPEHFDELERDAEKKRQAAAQRQLDKARTSGQKVPKLESLARNSYIDLRYSRAPEGCGEGCTCRGSALERGGKIVEICTDAKRFQRLTAKVTRDANAAKRAELASFLDRLNDKLDTLAEVGPSELGIVVAAALRNLHETDFKDAVKWVGGLVDAKDLGDFRKHGNRPRELAQLLPGDLIKMAVYAILHNELRNAIQVYGGSGNKPWATWYLANQRQRPRGRPLVEAFDRDGHVAEEIAAEAERELAEFVGAIP